MSSIRYAAFAVLMAAVPTAFAGGTAAGTTVSNTASVDFTVGGIDQPDVSSNTATFKVDRKIDVTTSSSSNVTDGVPGQTGRVISFTVTNLSNSVQDFRLTATQTGSPTDDFDIDNLTVLVDDGDGVYEPLQDTATFIDELGIDAQRVVYVRGDLPISRVNGDDATVVLVAIARQNTLVDGSYDPSVGALASADSAETNTGTADNLTFVDTVFADGDGDGDANQDGAFGDTGSYTIESANLVVTKSSRVVSDPINGTTNPKSIPGAVVEYCIDVSNIGAASAAAVALSDTVPVNTTFQAGSIKLGVLDLDAAMDSTDCDPATGAAGGSFAANTVSGALGVIAAGSRAKALFRVTID